jgi:hypothetical protein
MYTINKSNGIGQVVSENEKSYSVYFADTDKTCTLLKAFTTTYATEQEAEIALNPELTAQDMADIAADTKTIDLSVFHKIEAINAASSKELMKHI